jgi:hypothetical protein
MRRKWRAPLPRLPGHRKRQTRVGTITATTGAYSKKERIENAIQLVNESIARSVDASALAHNRIDESILQLTKLMRTYIQSADAYLRSYIDATDTRMRRLEDDLSALIRAITAEHGNGKS